MKLAANLLLFHKDTLNLDKSEKDPVLRVKQNPKRMRKSVIKILKYSHPLRIIEVILVTCNDSILLHLFSAMAKNNRPF